MRRRQFICLLGGTAAWPFAARAQQGGKKYVVGRFNAGSVTDPVNEVVTEALRQLGWVEGENVVYERHLNCCATQRTLSAGGGYCCRGRRDQREGIWPAGRAQRGRDDERARALVERFSALGLE